MDLCADTSRPTGCFCYIFPETSVPPYHPIRPIRIMVEKALDDLSFEFTAMYSHTGRPSVQQEKLLKALLLQAFYSFSSIRLLMEQIQQRKRVEEIFGWMETTGRMRKTGYVGKRKVELHAGGHCAQPGADENPAEYGIAWNDLERRRTTTIGWIVKGQIPRAMTMRTSSPTLKNQDRG